MPEPARRASPAVSSHEDAQLIRVPNDSEVLEFSGAPVGSASTESPGKLRWVIITLYRLADGTGRYVLHRVGKSRVYHRLDSPCNRGAPVSPGQLPVSAVPCGLCSPPVRAVLLSMPGEQVSAEVDRHGAVVCENAPAVLARLRMPDPVSPAAGVIGSSYSAPAQRLLDEARAADEGIKRAMATVRRL